MHAFGVRDRFGADRNGTQLLAGPGHARTADLARVLQASERRLDHLDRVRVHRQRHAHGVRDRSERAVVGGRPESARDYDQAGTTLQALGHRPGDR